MSLKSVTAHLFPLVDFFSPRQRQNVSADGSIDKAHSSRAGSRFHVDDERAAVPAFNGSLAFIHDGRVLKKDVTVVNAFVTCLRSSLAVILI